jgi:hypothetical protein
MARWSGNVVILPCLTWRDPNEENQPMFVTPAARPYCHPYGNFFN